MERLTSKKLMIGDWVHSPYSKKNERVSGMTLKHIRLFKGDFFTRTYEPIPITPEILITNNIDRDRNLNHNPNPIYVWTMLGDSFSLRKDIDLWLVNIRKFDRGVVYKEFSGRIKYVHELQHAIRLCDIDKEITL